MDKLLQIFRTGTHTAMSGQVLTFSEADLAACAAAYDPTKHEAPVVIGHPKTDAPAYAWVASVTAVNGALEAEPKQVDPAFAELVDAGRYKKISAAFYAPDDPANPTPGVYYLRHVGVLGAQPPSVKGLRQVAFAAAGAALEFADWSDRDNASLWRRLRDWMLAKFGTEDADRALPSFLVESLESEAQRDLLAPDTAPAFAQPTQEATVTPQEAAALKAENDRLKAQLVAQATAERRQEATAFAEALVAGGQLAPKDRATVVAALEFADTPQNGAALEFGEGDQKRPLGAALRELFKGLPKVPAVQVVAWTPMAEVAAAVALH